MVIQGADLAAVSELEQRVGAFIERLNAVVNADHAFVSGIRDCWVGEDSAQFTNGWQGQDRPAIEAVVASLTMMQSELRTNRLAQEETSNTLGGFAAEGRPTVQPRDAAEGRDALGLLLRGMELSGPVQEIITAIFHDADSEMLTKLIPFITSDVPAMLGGAALATEFFIDVAAQYEQGLPMDEVILHAVFETSARLAVEVGADKAVHAVTVAVTAALSGGSLAFAGHVIGSVAGTVVGEVIKQGVGAVGGYEAAADVGIEAYRAAKAGVEMVGNAVEPIVNAVEQGVHVVDSVVDTGVQIVGDGIDAIGRGAGAVTDGIGEVADRLWPL